MLAALGIRATVVHLPEPEVRRIVREPPSLFLTCFACDTRRQRRAQRGGPHTDKARGSATATRPLLGSPLDAQIDSSAIERAEVRRLGLQRILGAVGAAHVVLPHYYDENVYALKRGRHWQPRVAGYALAWDERRDTLTTAGAMV